MNKAFLAITVLVLCVNARALLAQSSSDVPTSGTTIAPETTTTEAVSTNGTTEHIISTQTASQGPTGSDVPASTTGVFTTGGPVTTTQNCPATTPSFSVGAFFLGMLVALVVVVVGYLLWYFFYYRKHSHGNAYAHFS